MYLGQHRATEQFDKPPSATSILELGPGDTVIVNVKVVEGERTRVQAYEGVCIGRSGGGLNESFTVRKISYGEGVERVFPVKLSLRDRKSTRLNSSHVSIPYAVFCLKKKHLQISNDLHRLPATIALD